MPIYDWFTLGLSGVGLAVALGIQATAMAFFLGKMKASSDAMAALVNAKDGAQTALLEAFKEFNQQTLDSLGDRFDRGYDEVRGLAREVQASKVETARLDATIAAHEKSNAERERRAEEWQHRTDERLNEQFAQMQVLARRDLGVANLKGSSVA